MNMNEEQARLNFEYLDRCTKERHLPAARVEAERDKALVEWQRVCIHEFSEPKSVYGYSMSKHCLKCGLDVKA